MLKKLLYFILFFTIFQTKGQSPSYIQYGLSEGLPNGQIYELFQDSRGYIWALTEVGIQRFNGLEFEEIPREADLEPKLPIDILEDKKNTIWILFLDGSIGSFNYQNEKIQAHPMNSEIIRILEKTKYGKAVLNNSFGEMNDGGLAFSFYHYGSFKVYLDSVRNIQPNPIGNTHIINLNGVKLISQGTVIAKNGYLDTATHFICNETPFDVVSPKDINRLSAGTGVYVFSTEEDDYIIHGNFIIRLENDGIGALQFFEDVIFGTTSLNDGEITILQKKHSPIIIDSKTLQTIHHSSLPFHRLTYCIKDQDGGIWYSTLNDGIIHVPLPKLSQFESTKSEQISELYFKEDTLYYGTMNGKFGFLNKDKDVTLIEDKSLEKIKLIHEIDNKIICLSDNNFIVLKKNKVSRNLFHLDYPFNPKGFLTRNDTLFLTRNNGIHFIYNHQLYFKNQVLIDSNNLFLSANDINYTFPFKNICSWKNFLITNDKNTIYRYLPKAMKIDTLFSSMEVIEHVKSTSNGIFCVTKKGLYWWDQKSNKTHLLLPTTNFSINSLQTNAYDLWVLTTQGIYRFVWNIHTQDFDTSHFPISKTFDEISLTTMELSEEMLYLGTTSGIFQIPISQLTIPTTPLNLTLRRIENTGIVVDNKTTATFDYKHNNFSFYLDLLNTKNRSEISIYYRLNKDESWQKTTNLKIVFPYLAPNEYHFQAKACLNGSCSEIQSYRFKITPAFWERSSVQLSALTFFVLGILFIYTQRLNKIKNERAIEQKLIQLEKRAKELQQKALAAQMNPHFIFNALSSIQSFILNNDISTSEKYLIDFGHLMRLILESSSEQFITIDKEKKLLESYLSLEQLRYDFTFQFEIDCEESLLDEGFKIPAMILQPLVENAIVHGVKDIKNGTIKITFKDHDKFIVCIIEDNGSGKSNVKKEYDGILYESRATKIISERLNILKIDYPETTISLTDLSKEGGTGMVVKIDLPIIS